MSVWIVVPAKASGAGKARLAGVLDIAARERLVAAMLAHVLAVVGPGGPERRVFVVGPPRADMPAGIGRIDDPGGGLDVALAHARDRAVAAGADRVLLIAGDLPLLTAVDVAALLEAGPSEIAIGGDRAGQGTNALSLPLPAAAAFGFAYGPGSFARHAAEAARLRLTVRPITHAGVATDIDVPADLPLVPAALSGRV